jgi:exodeoxyribonuclease V beta subunit
MSETWYYRKPDAITELPADEHAVIEASAGTGKTYTLEHLVVDRIVAGVPIDAILVVTFTRRATSDMLGRIRRKLQQFAQGDDALEALGDDAPESAYWSIGPDEQQRLQRAVTNFDRAQIFTIHSFCQRVLEDYPFDNRHLFDGEHVDEEWFFDRCFWEVLRHRFTQGECRPYFEAWMEATDGNVEKLKRRLFELHGLDAELRPERADFDEASLLEAAAAGELSEKGGYRVRTLVLHVFSEVIDEELERRKSAEGYFTFDDMLDRVWQTLDEEADGDDRSMTAALRERYRYAIVDEFQDTDPTQWKIFERLFVEGSGDHTLYIIGDPKQSIYGFRGADVYTYLDAREQLTEGRDESVVPLTDNYRSTEELIEGYNALLTAGDEPFFTTDRIGYDEVGCGFDEREALREGKSIPAVELMEVDQPEEVEDVDRDDLEYSLRTHIADAIDDLLGGSPLEVSPDPGEDESAVEIGAGDVYVLTRTNGEAHRIGEELEKRGIAHQFYRERGLFQTPEARDILELLRAVADPWDGSLRRRAYLTPFFAVPMGRVLSFDDVATEEGAPRKLLRDWHQIAERHAFERLFDRIVRESGVVRRKLLLDNGERELINYRHIFELLTNEASRAELGLRELVSWLHALVEEEEPYDADEGNVQRVEGDRDAVQIMTIHKSKGLEAEVVFVYGGFGRNTRGLKVFVDTDGESHDRLAYVSTKMIEDDGYEKSDWRNYLDQEGQRLFYVAMTRAKSKLYLSYPNAECVPRSDSWDSWRRGDYAPVLEKLDALAPEIRHGGWDDDVFEIAPVEYRRLTAPTESLQWHRLSGWKPPEIVEMDFDHQVYFKGHREDAPEMTSFTTIQARRHSGFRTEEGDDLDEVTAGDPQTEPSTDPREWQFPRGTEAGSALHDLLERLEFEHLRGRPYDDWAEHPAVESLIYSTLNNWGFEPDEWREGAQQLIWRALRTPIDLPGDGDPIPLCELERTAREVEFYLPIPEGYTSPEGEGLRAARADAGFVEGSIDFAFEYDDRIYIADWKSNAVEEGYAPSTLHDIVSRKYPMQAILYTMATMELMDVDSRETFESRFGGCFYFFFRGMDPSSDGDAGICYLPPNWEQMQEHWRSAATDWDAFTSKAPEIGSAS